MDNFLTHLYEEEQEKVAAADLGNYMGTLPTNELEEFLGLGKVAVAGPDEAPLPDSEKGQLEKDQKRVDADVAKAQDLSPPKRKEAMINRIQKIAAKSVMDKDLLFPKRKEASWRGVAGLATVPVLGAGIGALASPKGEAGTGAKRGALTGAGVTGGSWLGGLSGALGGAGLGALGGAGLGALGGNATAGAILGGAGGATIGSLGGGLYGAIKGGKAAHRFAKKRNPYEIEQKSKKTALKRGQLKSDARQVARLNKTSAAKAEIVMQAMRVTQGAPPHIKQAAAQFAGQELAKLGKKDDEYTVVPGSWTAGQKVMIRASQRPGAKGIGKIMADPTLIGERQIGGVRGGLKGVGIGLGAGALLGGGASLLSRGRIIDPVSGTGIGAALGGALGLQTGNTVGMAGADKKFLAARGIKLRGMGLMRPHLTEQAAKKYLTSKEGIKARKVGG